MPPSQAFDFALFVFCAVSLSLLIGFAAGHRHGWRACKRASNITAGEIAARRKSRAT
jgi:hypothetical protein